MYVWLKKILFLLVYVINLGPKEDTVADFWRMVWEQKVATVVMLTNLKERKEVCFFYYNSFFVHTMQLLKFDFDTRCLVMVSLKLLILTPLISANTCCFAVITAVSVVNQNSEQGENEKKRKRINKRRTGSHLKSACEWAEINGCVMCN